MSKNIFFLLLFALSLLPGGAFAEISADTLPDMGNLSAMLGTKADTKTIEKSVVDSNGKIGAGLPAPDTARGETFAVMAKQLSGGSESMEKRLLEAMQQERQAFEKFLANANFRTDDMGVAYAAAFITLWELASHKELPTSGSLAAGKFLVHSFKGIAPKYTSISDEEKAKTFDWMISVPVGFASLIKGFEKHGKTTEAEMMRKHTARLFKETFKIPHDWLVISDTGKISVDTEKMTRSQKQQPTGSNDTAKQPALQAGW